MRAYSLSHSRASAFWAKAQAWRSQSQRCLTPVVHHVCDPVPELRIQFRNRGFEAIPDDLSKPVTAFVAHRGFRRDLHMSAEPAEPPGVLVVAVRRRTAR
jgi:hypothetical protein